MTNRKNLDELFSLLRDIPPTRRRMTSEEIVNVLETPTRGGSARRWNVLNRKATMTAVIISIVVGVATLAITRYEPAGSPRQRATIATPPAHSAISQASSAGGASAPARAGHGDVPAPQTHRSSLEDMTTQSRRNGSSAGTHGDAPTAAHPHTSSPERSHDAAPVDHDRISGLRIVELTKEELARLGITVTDDEVSAFMESRYTIDNASDARWLHALGFDTTRRNGMLRRKVRAGLTITSIASSDHAPIDTISKVAPIIISSDWISDVTKKSEESALTYDDEAPLLELFHVTWEAIDTNLFTMDSSRTMRSVDERYAMLANKLIPIRIRHEGPVVHGSGSESRSGVGECTLWYLPTTEFVAALPERYAVPLREEIELLAGLAQEKLPPGEVCERLTGPTFFDYCRKSSGALAIISVYPNPSRGKATCRFALAEARTLSIALYDISGNHLRDLASARRMERGEHEVPLEIEGMRSGTYLIRLKSEKGEQVVQRVIVE